MRALALLLGLGGLGGTWWAWWSVDKHVPLAFRWWFELYIEPYIILVSVAVVSIAAWDEVRLWIKNR